MLINGKYIFYCTFSIGDFYSELKPATLLWYDRDLADASSTPRITVISRGARTEKTPRCIPILLSHTATAVATPSGNYFLLIILSWNWLLWFLYWHGKVVLIFLKEVLIIIRKHALSYPGKVYLVECYVVFTFITCQLSWIYAIT